MCTAKEVFSLLRTCFGPASILSHFCHIVSPKMVRLARVTHHSAGEDLPNDQGDDIRGQSVIRAWGCRRVKTTKQEEVPHYGRVNPKSLKSVARLPKTAVEVDPVVRQSLRSAGGQSLAPAYHQRFEYYTKYGNAGYNATTSQHHNFPIGKPPMPTRIYSQEPLTRCTKIRPSTARAKVSVGTNTA